MNLIHRIPYRNIIKPYFYFELKKHFWIIVMMVIFIVMFLIARRTYKYTCNTNENKYIIHDDEILPQVAYYAYEPEEIKYVFWTGGYDSTFLLCYYFIVQDKPVQPIYITCQNLDSRFGTIGRKNQSMELKTMKIIRKTLIERYPYKKNRLLPTHYVMSIKKDNDVSRKFIKLHKKNNYFTRDLNQYERMARYSLACNYPIMIGLERCGTGLDEATQNHRVGKWENCRILPLHLLDDKHKELDIFRNIIFSICHLTKKDMKNLSLYSNNYFYDILYMTVSCWYPTNKGLSCGECPMCKQRII